MKENKFRIWEHTKKKLSYVGKLDYLPDVGGYNFHTIGCEIIPSMSNVIVIQQFIGKLDVNECEIYEGDIVEYIEKMYEHRDATKAKGIIKYCSELCAYGAADTLDGYVTAYFFEGVYNHWKVIGNIYENKDLIK